MTKGKNAGLEFAVDSNVHIEIISPQNVIRQTIDKHNKATKRLVSGILRFIRGEFNTTYRRTDEAQIIYAKQAKSYIPCYIGFGTAGVRLTQPVDDTPILPDYDPVNRRIPPLTEEWVSDTNKVQYTDTALQLEITTRTRSPIGVLGSEEIDDFNSQVGDIQQIIFAADIGPGYYSDMYGPVTDIFLTEVGLFASGDVTEENLLARVIFKDDNTVLYVRPQDTIVVRWTVSIIALNEISATDEDISGTDINIDVGTVIDDTADYTGTIDEGD